MDAHAWLGFVALGIAAAAGAAPAGCAETSATCGGADGCPAGTVCRGDRCVPAGDAWGDADGTAADADADAPADVPAADADAPGEEGDGPGEETDAPCATFDFPFSVTPEVLEVPLDVRYLHVKAWGGGGNEEHRVEDCGFEDAGMGGYAEAVFDVLPGSRLAPGMSLTVVVGQLGRAGTSEEELARVGFSSRGGGGLSGVFVGADPLTENDRDRALVIAGGGGSAAGATPCIAGGHGCAPGSGGQPTMRGGTGGDEVNGGGGGYEGGPGGARREPGTAGSCHVDTSILDDPAHYRTESASGYGIPPRSTDPDYADSAGAAERNGRVVIHFTCEPPPFI